jgi:hypothetical protein
MAKEPKKNDALTDLLAIAPAKVLTDLTLHLAAKSPDTRRMCLDFLKTHVSLTDDLAKRSEGEVIIALWDELEADLSDLDEYGGGDHDIVDRVGDLLYQICKHLEKKTVSSDDRHEILDHVLSYIESDNSGMVDSLYDVAYATCYDDEDWIYLAESLEAMQGDWQIDHARRIYKKLNRREEYLALRQRKMIYGADFYDLATFYWESGEKEKALQVAEKGLQKGKGRMDELRLFLVARAEETGDRGKYLALQFAQAVDGLTFAKYQAFQQLCAPEEWTVYEPQILTQMQKSGRSDQLKIRMHREEYAEALVLLKKGRYPIFDGSGDCEIQTAKVLEQRYPEEILKFYHTGLGHLNENNQRQEYARKAVVVAKICHVLVNVLGDVARWQTFAGKIKRENFKRPAFQDEFARIVPGWRELK